MELHELGRRIIGQHWLLILAFFAAGLGVAAFMHGRNAPTYTASSRFVMDTRDPESRAESSAIADTARGIATSPSQVDEALARAGVTGRDPESIAETDVALQALGSSGVLELSVTDEDPLAAAAIANALAAQVIATRLDASTGQAREALTELEDRISDLAVQIATLDADIDNLNRELEAAETPRERASLTSEHDEAVETRATLFQQRSAAESTRSTLLSSSALRPKSAIISGASAPESADPSGWLVDLALGGVLGLVLGIAAAGILEALRPTLVGGQALADEFDTPYLGDLPAATGAGAPTAEMTQLAVRLELASKAAGVRSVGVLATPAGDEASWIIAGLRSASEAHVNGAANAETAEVREGAPLSATRGTRISLGERATVPLSQRENDAAVPLDIQAFGASGSPFDNGARVGLVLASPNRLKKSKASELDHLVRIIPGPLVGLITYHPPRRSSRRHIDPEPTPTEATGNGRP